MCVCDCGGSIVTYAKELLGGRTKACGCRRARTSHGLSHSSTYGSWLAMRRRCTLRSHRYYHRYGGRGISVCERWQSFENFLADMGERPLGHTIDRFPDRNGNYEPGNCRWATVAQQTENRDRKLESHEPEQIRWLVSLGYTHKSVADFFGVDASHVSRISGRRSP